MTRIIQDLRIGTKLAITSALSILLVASMIYLQMTGGADVRRANDTAARQQGVAQNAAEAKASVRGISGANGLLRAAGLVARTRNVNLFPIEAVVLLVMKLTSTTPCDGIPQTRSAAAKSPQANFA